jgi:hypothetical protein
MQVQVEVSATAANVGVTHKFALWLCCLENSLYDKTAIKNISAKKKRN